MTQRRPTIGGNWKMNTLRESAAALAHGVATGADRWRGRVDVAVFPPFLYLDAVREVLGGGVTLGAQDLYHEPRGAFTGEVSVEMLRNVGVEAVLVGHSERRHVIAEPDDLISRKLRAALEGGLKPTLCIGETLDQREAGETDAVNRRQLESALAGLSPESATAVTIAYEPVWAIGTGRTASPDDAEAAHLAIRATVASLYDVRLAESLRIQYGGSVKAANAADLISAPNVDGFLVGGASLEADEFLAIVDAAIGSA